MNSGAVITLWRREGRVAARLIPPSRLRIGALLAGKTPQEAVETLGLVYNMCPEAHRAAARAALGLAQPQDVAERLALERLRETAQPLLRDWAELLGDPPFADGPPDFSNRAALTREIETLAERLSPCAARFGLERLIREALKRLQSALSDGGSSISSGGGWGAARAARGQARHRAQTADGRIASYAIRTPTDAMFAPGGPLARAFALIRPEASLLDGGRFVLACLSPACAVDLREGAPAHA